MNETKKEESLASSIPESTLAERRRFLKARDDNVKKAAKGLKKFLDWIEMNRYESPRESEDTWEYASRCALSKSELKQDVSCLPPLIFRDNLVTKSGVKVFQVISATIDVENIDPETYAQAIAIYLHQIFDRNSMEKYCIVIDVRAGNGWANPSPLKNMNYIKAISSLASEFFPER